MVQKVVTSWRSVMIVQRCILYDNLPPLSALAVETLSRELESLSSAQKVFLVARLLGLPSTPNNSVCIGQRLNDIIFRLMQINFSKVKVSPVDDVDTVLRREGLHLGDLVEELREGWVG